ncbi:hypothetical protein, partial [uncultured Duncaniella sp.]|uniref:hypothetical protein n=1 Tax=uncultured Duncaniella sp. TaxID=2768039 RepID=UPI0025B6695A
MELENGGFSLRLEIFFTFLKKNFEKYLHSSNITPTFAPSKGNNTTPDDKTMKIALWCNGSTSDSGSACE